MALVVFAAAASELGSVRVRERGRAGKGVMVCAPESPAGSCGSPGYASQTKWAVDCAAFNGGGGLFDPAAAEGVGRLSLSAKFERQLFQDAERPG